MISQKGYRSDNRARATAFWRWSGLGLVETHIGNYDAALKAYEKAATIHPFLEGYGDMVEKLKKLAQGTPL